MKVALDSEAGFTLIELLVSMAVLSAIMVLLGGTLHVLGKNADASAGQIEALDMSARALDILARDAANLRRVPVRTGGSAAYVFSGSAERLSFVALEPPRPTHAGLYFIEYSLAPNGGGVDLIRARARYQEGMTRFPGATPANRIALLQGGRGYRFAYARIEAGTPVWHADWPFADRLPDLIRLDPAGFQHIVTMTVRTRSTAELECLMPAATLCSAGTGGQLGAKAEARQEVQR